MNPEAMKVLLQKDCNYGEVSIIQGPRHIWTVPQRPTTPTLSNSSPIYVHLANKKHRTMAKMEIKQTQPHVQIHPDRDKKGTIVDVGRRFTNEKDLQIELSEYIKLKEHERLIMFPPKWLNTPVTADEWLKVEVAFLKFTLEDLATIKARIEAEDLIEFIRKLPPDENWHLVFVVVNGDDSSFTRDLDVTLSEAQPFSGPNNLPTTKILTSVDFERLLIHKRKADA